MSDVDSPLPEEKHPSRRTGILARLRSFFFAGVLVTAPLTITIGLAWWFIDIVDSKVTPLIPARYNPVYYLPPDYQEYGIPGLGLLLVFLVITLVGWVTTNVAGKSLIRLSERILDRIPAVRSIYAAIKQILETVLANQSAAFRKAVLVEYPRRGLWAIAFITGNTKGEVQNLTEQEVVNIFLPTTPNPTSGFLLFVPRENVVELDMSVEEAVKMVISGGIVTPPDRRPIDQQNRPAFAARRDERVEAAPPPPQQVVGN